MEDRYLQVFRLEHVRPSTVADSLAEAQVRFPSVPIIFAETRPLAQEWTFRFVGAAVAELSAHHSARDPESTLAPAGPVPEAPPSPAEIRRWAAARGVAVSARGRVPASVVEAYLADRAI